MQPRSASLAFSLGAAALLALASLGVTTAPASAQPLDYDTPQATPLEAGTGKLRVEVIAGATGAPAGFTLWLMKRDDFEDNGEQWYQLGDSRQTVAIFEGVPTLNTEGGTISTFALSPNQRVVVELGDLFDETGVTTNNTDELDAGQVYVVCAFANATRSAGASETSPTDRALTTVNNCTYTQGFWKSHGSGDCHSGNNSNLWPASATPMLLGTVSYSAAQLCAIFNTPAAGNGLISLAHQLITAKMNIANGADGSSIASIIAAADAQIGNKVVPPIGSGFLSPGSTSAKTQALDDYNNGITGPGHCGTTPTHARTWGNLKVLYR